jgi:hypothetical protein
MLKQLDPATLLAKFEDIAKAGTKVVESNISSGQLGSFVDLAMKAKGQDVSRLTIGPPDFDAAFSTSPDFDVIHARVAKLLAGKSAGAAEDMLKQPGTAGGPLSAAGPLSPGAAPAAPPSPSPSDFTPVTTTPDGQPITEEMLNQFKRNGDEQSIRDLVATNGQCAPL